MVKHQNTYLVSGGEAQLVVSSGMQQKEAF